LIQERNTKGKQTPEATRGNTEKRQKRQKGKNKLVAPNGTKTLCQGKKKGKIKGKRGRVLLGFRHEKTRVDEADHKTHCVRGKKKGK